MFRFGSPYMLYLLLVVPTLVVLYWLAMRARARRIRRFGDPATVAQLMPDASPRRVRNKFIILLCALTAIIFGIARPQVGSKLKEQKRSGIEMMLVVDVSNSMLAQDFEPNRLEQTKMAITRLMNEMKQDRVGLIVFAGDAYVQLPITSDYTTARSFVSRLSTDMVSKQGTAIGSAIDLAANSFSSDSEGSRVVVLISDGESLDDDPLSAAQRAYERGISIYTIGIGTPEGAPMMLGGDYIRDENGNMALTHLNEEALQKIAILTDGAYLRATRQSLGLKEIVEQINQTQKAQFSATVFEEYDEFFQYPLAIGLLLLLIEMIMLSRKNHLLARFNIFKNE
ncbi:VWA domain-containing protein [Alistipes sp. OttesenSCG-928-B03]|nr:VWA domain-containing protein [Alistipes sp. OttesenSCG-928-B03]